MGYPPPGLPPLQKKILAETLQPALLTSLWTSVDSLVTSAVGREMEVIATSACSRTGKWLFPICHFSQLNKSQSVLLAGTGKRWTSLEKGFVLLPEKWNNPDLLLWLHRLQVHYQAQENEIIFRSLPTHWGQHNDKEQRTPKRNLNCLAKNKCTWRTLCKLCCGQRQKTTEVSLSNLGPGTGAENKRNEMIDHFRDWKRCTGECWQLLKLSCLRKRILMLMVCSITREGVPWELGHFLHKLLVDCRSLLHTHTHTQQCTADTVVLRCYSFTLTVK